MRFAKAEVSGGTVEDDRHQDGQAKASLLRRWPISDTDRAIIGHLQEDGRRAFVTIARELGLSEKTVRLRTANLLESNIIQIAALTSPAALGYRASAMAGLTTDPSVPASEISMALREIPHVDYVIVTAGRYNLLAEIITYDLASMQAVIEQQIGKVKGIRSIELFPYFSISYQNARFFGAHGGDFGSAVTQDELEEIDKLIALELNPDGRAPLKAIGSRLGISESQVRTRIKHMIETGKMRIMAIINPMNLPDHAIAYAAVQAGHDTSLRAVADQLAQVPQVSYVSICAGRYDLFAEVVCSSSAELMQVIDLTIRSLPGVAKAETFIYIDLHYKRLVPTRA